MTVAIKDRRADPVPIVPVGRPGRVGRRPAPPEWFLVPALLLFGFVVLVPSARIPT
jgi:raffinose/stachyose/melibiose transport system permease protein